MGLLDNIFGGSNAVPGGNISKPLMIALMALLAARYMGGKKSDTAPAGSQPASTGSGDPSPGDIVGGLGGLFKQFEQNGYGGAISSWIGDGANKGLNAQQLEEALGPEVITQLSQRTGIPEDQIKSALTQLLPQVVDKLTPQGRLPTHEEAAKMV